MGEKRPANRGLCAPPAVLLRRARRGDYEFAAALYLQSTRPLLIALGRWNQRQVVARFRRAFRPEHGYVIRSHGADIGWMQVTENGRRYHVQQLHLVERFRNRGIGRRLLQHLMNRARDRRKFVALNVIQGNRAAGLYQRLGFRTMRTSEGKLHMRWVPAARGAAGPTHCAGLPLGDSP